MNARLDELLLQYEELRERGEPTSPEELCRDCPELLDEMKRELADLDGIDQLLRTPPHPQPLSPGGARGESKTPPHPQPLSPGGARRESVPSIPGFEVLEELGRGGMGVVYKAYQISLKRQVALKMILAGSFANAEQQGRLRTEAEAVARIQHPNIVQIHDIGAHESKPFLVLEYVEGTSLEKELASAWPAQQAAELVRDLARAVHAAHRAGIVHRDLKPANVLMQISDGRLPPENTRPSAIPKIADFGLAKQLGNGPGQTESGAILGTPSYMAPEQAAGKIHEIGPWTDIHALGAILYELLTGRPPFKGDSTLATLEQVRTQAPLPPRKLQPNVPRDLETICLQALHKEPARRYASAQDLADDVDRFLSGEAIRARPDPVWWRLRRWLCRDERIRDAGFAMLVNAAVRTVAITQMFRVLARADLEREPWLPAQLAVWLVGMCIALFWAGWRTLGRHVVALWAGLFLSIVYLGTRSVSTFLEAEDERIFLYSLLFGIQLFTCTIGLVAYYSKRR